MEILVAFIDINRDVGDGFPKGPLPRLWINSDGDWIDIAPQTYADTVPKLVKPSATRSILILDDCSPIQPEILANLRCDGSTKFYIISHSRSDYNTFEKVQSRLTRMHCINYASIRHERRDFAYSRAFGLLAGATKAETFWADFMEAAKQKVISDLTALCHAVWLFQSIEMQDEADHCLSDYETLWNDLPAPVKNNLIRMDSLDPLKNVQGALQSLIAASHSARQ